MYTSIGEFKQTVLQIYNSVNKEIISYGVRQQIVDVVDNMIIIRSQNARVPVLKVLDEKHPDLSSMVNNFLEQSFKQKLKEELENRIGIRITSIFKDYDVETEISGTLIVLDKDVEKNLNDIAKLL